MWVRVSHLQCSLPLNISIDRPSDIPEKGLVKLWNSAQRTGNYDCRRIDSIITQPTRWHQSPRIPTIISTRLFQSSEDLTYPKPRDYSNSIEIPTQNFILNLNNYSKRCKRRVKSMSVNGRAGAGYHSQTWSIPHSGDGLPAPLRHPKMA